MRVLLAVDQSRDSQAAAQLFQRIQLPPESHLYLLHVTKLLDWSELPMTGRSLRLPDHIAVLRGEATAKAREVLSGMVKNFQRPGLTVQAVVSDGVPGEEILKTITEYDIDLVALGTRGLSKIPGFLLGSVSEWVLNEAPCSVLVVRGEARPKKSQEGLTVLLATDGSTDAKAAVTLLRSVTLPQPTHVTVLHVLEKPNLVATLAWAPGHSDASQLTEDIQLSRQQRGEHLLDQVKGELSHGEFKVDVNLVTGHPAEEIVKTAKRIQPDLLVVGSKGVTGLRRILLGSVSHKVVRHAPCSVLVVRPNCLPNLL